MATDAAPKGRNSAYDRIRELILTMAVRPGETLSENRLAERLGISRTPVREALTRLEQEGLVISSGRRKRAFVPTIREIEDIFDLKRAIESQVAGWAAKRGKDLQRKALRKNVEKMRAVAAGKPADPEELDRWHQQWLKLDVRYHDILFDMAGNERAQRIIETFNAYWHRLRLGILAIEDRIEKSAGEHEAVADAVIEGDSDRAIRLMGEHLGALGTMLVGIMRAFHYPEVLASSW